MLKKLLIGEIINVHGVKGALKVQPLTDDLSRFSRLKEVYVKDTKAKPDSKHLFNKTYKVISGLASGGFVLLRLYGIDDRDTADLFRGCFLEIDRKDAIKLPEDNYFIGDLIGCRVVETNGEELGLLHDVYQTGSNDVYAVKRPGKKDLLLPAIGSVVKDVDIENGVVTVELIAGLMDVYEEDGNEDED